MKNLIDIIKSGQCRGVLRSAMGELISFTNNGVVDLYRLVTEKPELIAGGMLADRVIGRGAALLLVKGGIDRVHALVMSRSASEVLKGAAIQHSCEHEVEHIANRTNTGMCPVEKATLDTTDPDVALVRIKAFLEDAGIIEKQNNH